MSSADKIISELKKKYNITGDYYPGISMEADFEKGFEGEVSRIIENLASNNFEASSQNVAQIMLIKKTFLENYRTQGNVAVEKYQKLLVEDVMPIGCATETVFLFVNGLTIVLIYLLGRFAGSFADEAGKQAAKKILNKNKKSEKSINIGEEEYKIFANEVNLLINRGEINNLCNPLIEDKLKVSKSRKSVVH